MEPTTRSLVQRRVLTRYATALNGLTQSGRKPSTVIARSHCLRLQHASSASRPSKPIILEPPDKFRPPSHPARLNSKRTTAAYGPYSGASYNQGVSDAEREAQRQRTYPHMFPKEGTVMHSFLTNRVIHLFISLGILSLLAIITFTQNFIKTSPFAYLLPNLGNYFWHPFTSIYDTFSVFKMHIDYRTEQTQLKRQQAILDVQKQRIYRRAHGMEDMSGEEDQGVDVRGIVPWDDGLTDKERARGGRRVVAMSGQQYVDQGGDIEDFKKNYDKEMRGTGRSEVLENFADKLTGRKTTKQGETATTSQNGESDRLLEQGSQAHEALAEDQPSKRRVKRWFGIWE